MNEFQSDITAVSFGGGGSCGTGRHIAVAEHFQNDRNIARWMGTSIGGFIAVLAANGLPSEEIRHRMYNLWRPSPASVVKAIAPKFFNPFKALKGNSNELQKAASYMGLLDQTTHVRRWCKGLEWNNAELVLFDLISRKRMVVNGDSGIELCVALSATMAVPGVFSPVVWFDPAGTRRLLVDGGVSHCHPTVDGCKTAVVKCMAFPGRDWLWTDSVGDVVIDVGAMPGLDVLLPPSRKEIDRQIKEARSRLGQILH